MIILLNLSLSIIYCQLIIGLACLRHQLPLKPEVLTALPAFLLMLLQGIHDWRTYCMDHPDLGA